MNTRRTALLSLAAATATAGGGVLAWRGLGRSSAPEVSYTLLDGRRGTLGDLRGRVVLVNFWATTCAICLKEMPRLVQTHQRYAPRGFSTLAVAMPYDPPARVAHYAESRALPFDVAIDLDGKVLATFGPLPGTPTSFVLDRQGRIAERIVGEPDFTRLHALIERLLGET